MTVPLTVKVLSDLQRIARIRRNYLFLHMALIESANKFAVGLTRNHRVKLVSANRSSPWCWKLPSATLRRSGDDPLIPRSHYNWVHSLPVSFEELIPRCVTISDSLQTEDACSTREPASDIECLTGYSAGQRQKAVSAHFTSEQILPFGFAKQHCYERCRYVGNQCTRAPAWTPDNHQASVI